MKTHKLVHIVTKHFLCHGVALKLVLVKTISNSDRIIFKIKLKPGAKESMVFERARDIQTALQLPLFQPFREGLSLFLAVSENPVAENSLMRILDSHAFRSSKMWIPVALGFDMRGGARIADLGKMPHAMYAGSTGSGKSIGLLCLLLSILYKQPVNQANLILFDVGANTMEPLSDVPHLSHPIVKDTETGIYVIYALVDEMERRIGLERDELRNLPALVLAMDEYVSFIANIGNKKLAQSVANSISNLLRRGRHAKIHVVLATQDPTLRNMKVDLGNITARMAFTCAKYHNSITILGEGGAEKLPGKGALLYKSSEHPKPVHLQGAYVSSEEIKRLVGHVISKSHDSNNKFEIPMLDPTQMRIADEALTENQSPLVDDGKELADIVLWALGRENISVNQIQQQFRMGNRANDIVDKLFKMNVVTDRFAKQPREVMPLSVEEIPGDVLELLAQNGITTDDIADAMSNRY